MKGRRKMKTNERVLIAITDLIKEKGYPPSVREISERVGLKSSSTTYGHMVRLKMKGLITWDESRPRTLRLVKDIPHEDLIMKSYVL